MQPIRQSSIGRLLFCFLPILSATLLLTCSDDDPAGPENKPPANHAPQFTAVESQNVQIGDTLEFTVTASDPDGDSLILARFYHPQHSEFIDHGDGTGGFTFMPSYLQVDALQVGFIASDNELADTLSLLVTVLAGPNHAPVISAPDSTSVEILDTLHFEVTADDPDHTLPTITALALPDNADFTATSGSGDFHFMPDSLQLGDFSATFMATDGELADTSTVSITVTAIVNDPPHIDLEGETSVLQGDTAIVAITVVDPDGPTLAITADSLPENAILSDHHDGTATLTFTPDYIQLGDYIARIIASDGTLADTVELLFEVLDAPNQAPRLEYLGDTVAIVGETLEGEIKVFDPEGDELSVAVVDAPQNLEFTDQGDGNWGIRFSPDLTQVGDIQVTFIASDLSLADTLTVSLTVLAAPNQLPVWEPVPNHFITSDSSLTFMVYATDADGERLSLSVVNLDPETMSFTDFGDNSGEFHYQPEPGANTSLLVKFAAADRFGSSTMQVQIDVSTPSQSPELKLESADIHAIEGEHAHAKVTIVDHDGGPYQLHCEAPQLTGAFTIYKQPDWASVRYEPSYTDAGFQTILIILFDGLYADTLSWSLFVQNFNPAPEFALLEDQAVFVGETLEFSVSATDPDSSTPTLSVTGLPENALFTDNGGGTGTIHFSPSIGQEGSYALSFQACDEENCDQLDLTIHCLPINDLYDYKEYSVFPAAIGNSWIYTDNVRHESRYSVVIVDAELVDGEVWWMLNIPYGPLRDRFCIKGDSIFSEQGLELVFKEEEGLCFAAPPLHVGGDRCHIGCGSRCVLCDGKGEAHMFWRSQGYDDESFLFCSDVGIVWWEYFYSPPPIGQAYLIDGATLIDYQIREPE